MWHYHSGTCRKNKNLNIKNLYYYDKKQKVCPAITAVIFEPKRGTFNP